MAKEYSILVEMLPNDVAGEVFKLLMRHANGEGIPSEGISLDVRIAFEAIRVSVDAFQSSYERKCERNRGNGSKGGRPRKEETVPEPESVPVPVPESVPITAEQPKRERKPRTVFVPPELHEVRDYMGVYSMNTVNSVEADKFMDFYASKGWMVGKNKMKDWKSAVRQWIRRISEFTNQKQNDNGDNRSNYEIAVSAIQRYEQEEAEWQRNGGDAQLDKWF